MKMNPQEYTKRGKEMRVTHQRSAEYASPVSANEAV